jgi:hypothetical protein
MIISCHVINTNLLFLYSQLGEGSKKCIRYWPDDEISHEHIHVKYIQSESCPYYTRRELSITNTKVSLIIDSGCASAMTHILPSALKVMWKVGFRLHCFCTSSAAQHLYCYLETETWAIYIASSTFCFPRSPTKSRINVFIWMSRTIKLTLTNCIFTVCVNMKQS